MVICRWGYRHQQTIILFFCFTVAYSIRACVGVSLVAMVYGFHDKSNITAVNENDTVKIDSEGSVSILNGIVFDEPYPSFSWSKKKQDAILSAFTWGYMTLQLPAGALAHRFGTRYLLTGALVVNGIISFCMPWAVYYKHLKVPWKKLLTCKGMWAIILAHIGQTWGQLTLYTEVPAFMDKVMKVNIKALDLVLSTWSGVRVSGADEPLVPVDAHHPPLAVELRLEGAPAAAEGAPTLGRYNYPEWYTAEIIRSISSTIGLITLAFVDKDIYVVETILVTICAFSISTNVGYHVNHIDIAPNFAGTLMSISNFVSNCVGSLAPIVAGCILTDVTSEYLWRKVFCVSAGFFFVTNLFYVIFGTAELADWNEPEEELLHNQAE
ncbi:hypothetical protein MSG28_010003 [Choristoneura fumiferana]|uniref:Uncharacterized protein n=1 Tax=Choristoneura fumiferana TaxID=7141 RepID=A0ACC0KIS9_CHOFU|nr:hypothetical protein MSG28_010003 [Choristoneura fumiferana]